MSLHHELAHESVARVVKSTGGGRGSNVACDHGPGVSTQVSCDVRAAPEYHFTAVQSHCGSANFLKRGHAGQFEKGWPGVQTMADDANVGGLGAAVENMKAKMKDAPPKAAPPKKEGIV